MRFPRLIIDRPSGSAKVSPRARRMVTLAMCRCEYDCYHKKTQAKSKALQRIFARHVHPCDEPTKLKRIKQLRVLYSRHEIVDVSLILDWLKDNGLPGDRNTRCLDTLHWAVANDCRPVLAKAKEQDAVFRKFSKSATESTELKAESCVASAEESRLLAMFNREYKTPDERRAKIAVEIAQIRIELNQPDLVETNEIVTYAIARICHRIELALPLLAERLAG